MTVPALHRTEFAEMMFEADPAVVGLSVDGITYTVSIREDERGARFHATASNGRITAEAIEGEKWRAVIEAGCLLDEEAGR